MGPCECCGETWDVGLCTDVDDEDVVILLCADCRDALSVDLPTP